MPNGFPGMHHLPVADIDGNMPDTDFSVREEVVVVISLGAAHEKEVAGFKIRVIGGNLDFRPLLVSRLENGASRKKNSDLLVEVLNERRTVEFIRGLVRPCAVHVGLADERFCRSGDFFFLFLV